MIQSCVMDVGRTAAAAAPPSAGGSQAERRRWWRLNTSMSTVSHLTRLAVAAFAMAVVAGRWQGLGGWHRWLGEQVGGTYRLYRHQAAGRQR